MNTSRNSKQTACLCRDTGGKGTLPAQHTTFNTLDNWSIKPPPNQKGKGPERKGYRVMARNMYTIHWVTSEQFLLLVLFVYMCVCDISPMTMTIINRYHSVLRDFLQNTQQGCTLEKQKKKNCMFETKIFYKQILKKSATTDREASVVLCQTKYRYRVLLSTKVSIGLSVCSLALWPFKLHAVLNLKLLFLKHVTVNKALHKLNSPYAPQNLLIISEITSCSGEGG